MSASLGQLIRRRRMELGLTQEELAERIGDTVRQAEISRLERDRIALPRRHRLEQIAAALELSVGELLVASGWAGAEVLDDDAASPESRAGDVSVPAWDAAGDAPHLVDAMDRAELLILRSEEAIALAHDTTSRVEQALSRRRGLKAASSLPR
jgi:transcriptional regulator with XRE-family HTH domain